LVSFEQIDNIGLQPLFKTGTLLSFLTPTHEITNLSACFFQAGNHQLIYLI
jgi:hypothetical protein